jgi:hypothetical protein
MTKAASKKIWIDLDNSPHVPFFAPIIDALERNGHRVIVTTRDCFQVCDLADNFGLRHRTVGRHYGANRMAKVGGTLWRSVQLAPYVLRERPDLSLSHGSRSLVILSSLLRIPTVLMFDYEHAKIVPFFRADLGIAPALIPAGPLKDHFKNGLTSYHGLKEDVYVATFRPDASMRARLGLRSDDIVVTIRPPATEAHYHNPESDTLFKAVVDFLGSQPNVRMVILPRNEKTQRELVHRTWPEWCANGTILVPSEVLNGLDLIWTSDFVISGGGTMNREAAALGVPVYSIFRGRLGAVDKYLADEGRLTLIASPDDVRAKIRVARRTPEAASIASRPALQEIVASIERMCAA